MIRGVELFFSLFNNLAIFIALVTVYGYLLRNIKETVRLKRQIFMGISFGLFAIGCMFAKIPVFEGVIVDQRNAIIALSGAFGGSVSAIVSASLAGAFRVHLGGGGAFAGVVGVSLAAVSGIILNHFPKNFSSSRNAFISSVFATLIILPGFLFVKDFHTGWGLMKAMALPYGMAIFSGIMLVGLLLNREKNELAFEVALKENQENLQKEIVRRKAVEEELRLSGERLDLALSGANEGIWDWNIKENIVYFGDRYYTMAGYEPSDFPGNYDEFAKRVHADDMERTQAAIDRYLAGEIKIYETEFRFLRKNRSYMWIQAKGKIVSKDDHGNPIRFTGTHTDITERKRAEQKLMTTTRRLQSITESSRDAIIVMDNQGQILFWNPAAKQIFGYTHQEAMGQNLHQLLMPQRYSDTQGNAFSIFQKTGQGKAINKTIELEAIKKDGEEVAIELSLSAIHAKEGWNAVGIIRDITDRKKTQEMLIQSEKMLSVGGLAAGMAHEINNPLAGMVQSANVMKNRLERIDLQANLKAAEELGIRMDDIATFMEKRNIFRMLDAIRDSGARATEIVNSMLSFARKSDANISSHYPDKLMDSILSLAATDYDLKRKYDFKSIEIIKEYADNLPILPCEGAKIQQVLLNILRNGAQAMQKAKTESPRFILRIYSKGEPAVIHIEIEDNGPGMDEKTRLKVFDPFFTTKPVGVGTGLGLSVSYFIITENHKGTMDVISEPGKGANFIIRIPVDRKRPVPGNEL